MDVYLYRAALYCESCGEDIRRELASQAPRDPSDERTYDSDDYPKGPYPDGGGESDSPQHCDAGEQCKARLRVRFQGRTYYVGAWLENPLTSEGVAYVRACKRGLMVRQWRQWYAEELGW